MIALNIYQGPVWQSTKYQRRIHPESLRVGKPVQVNLCILMGFFPVFQRVMIWLINLAIPLEPAGGGRRRRAAASVISDHQAQPAAAAASVSL